MKRHLDKHASEREPFMEHKWWVPLFLVGTNFVSEGRKRSDC